MKKSKRMISMILAVMMLSMTAIGVNAHDELPAEKIETTEIAVESVETEATGDSELLEEVEPSVSEIEMQSNESETEVEVTEEEELQPRRASRAIATCASAIGYTGASYSAIIYQNNMAELIARDNYVQKVCTLNNESYLISYFNHIYASQDIHSDIDSTSLASTFVDW